MLKHSHRLFYMVPESFSEDQANKNTANIMTGFTS